MTSQNELIEKVFPNILKNYKNNKWLSERDENFFDSVNSSEFLNSVDLSGFPPHVLQLKIGVPIILLRNIDPPKLCNGTRLAVKKKTMENLIEATILTGPFEGEAVLIPPFP